MIRRERVVWGLVGGLSFLVLVQGYELLADVRIGFGVKVGVAVLVAIVATGLAAVVVPRLLENGSA